MSYNRDFLELAKKDLDKLGDTKDVAETWGPGGLLGHYLSMNFLNTPKFNIDFPNSQLNWRPNDRWKVYARPDTMTDTGKPSGIKIGGSYNF